MYLSVGRLCVCVLCGVSVIVSVFVVIVVWCDVMDVFVFGVCVVVMMVVCESVDVNIFVNDWCCVCE